MAEDHQKEAAKLGFDLTKQFLTLAFAGIAFVVGISSSRPDAISTVLLWWSIGVFATSAIFGLLFLMRGVNRLNEEQSFDVYAVSLRIFSTLQILSVAAGVILLCVVVAGRRPTGSSDPHAIKIIVDGAERISYPIEPDKNTIIEIEAGKIKMSVTKP